MKKISESTVVICGIVRNAEHGLDRNIPVINEFVESCKDYRIYIFENDSTDRTKEILKEWTGKDPERIIVETKDFDSSNTIPETKMPNHVNPFFSRKRIDKMAALRNNYMHYINQLDLNVDYVVVVDLDVAQLYLNGILTSFDSRTEWDAVCANGYSLSPKLKRRYHDTYALTLWDERNESQTEEKIKKYADLFGHLKEGDEWVRIASGFGGIAIYRYEAIKGLLYAEPSLNNEDDRVEVKCEHYSLYEQMIKRGFTHFYINPAMTLKYQKLSLEIIKKSLMRKIFGS